jgi:hypothetical protein
MKQEDPGNDRCEATDNGHQVGGTKLAAFARILFSDHVVVGQWVSLSNAIVIRHK